MTQRDEQEYTFYEYRKLCDFIEEDILRINGKDHKIAQIKREAGYVALYWFDHGVPQAQTGREYETYLAAKRQTKGEGVQG